MTKSYSYLFDEIEGLRVKIAKLIELQESALEQMSLIERINTEILGERIEIAPEVLEILRT